MKRAIALSALLSVSLVSFAFAQSPGREVTVVPGQTMSFAHNGEQIIVKNMEKDVASIKFNFLPEHLSGTIQIVEYPPYTSDHDIWISKTPGGEAVPGFEKQRFQWFGGPIHFYHPSLKALGGRYATFKYLDHGTYYYNMLPVSEPAYASVAHTFRTASMSSQAEVSVFSPTVSGGGTCTTLTTDLEYDTDHPDVKLLQKFLNANGYKIASSGAGSAGNETTTFWDGTRTQVIKFQTDNGISPTGTVGPITRTKIKELSCGTTKSTASTGSTTIESLLALIAQLRSQLDALTGTKSTATAPTLTVAYPGKVLSNKSGSPIATIFWMYSDLTAKITLELHDEDGLVRTLATKTGNSGRYTWDYSSTVRDGEYTLIAKAYGTDGTLLSTDETDTFEVSKTKMAVGSSESGTGTSAKSTVSFVAAPIVRNSAGVPIVTSTYDLNANPFHRLIPATGGTRSVAIAFPATRGGYLMMTPGVNEYVRPDRTEVNISAKPNDFTPMQARCNQVNEISSDIMLQWVTQASDAPSWGACILEQGKIYYFNIRYVKADGTTACVQDTCGAYMDLPF